MSLSSPSLSENDTEQSDDDQQVHVDPGPCARGGWGVCDGWGVRGRARGSRGVCDGQVGAADGRGAGRRRVLQAAWVRGRRSARGRGAPPEQSTHGIFGIFVL